MVVLAQRHLLLRKTGISAEQVLPQDTIVPWVVTNCEDQAMKCPETSTTLESDYATVGQQHMRYPTPNPTLAAAGAYQTSMADIVTGYRNTTDPWSYSTVPPARYEKPWYQGRILPAQHEVPRRDLRVNDGYSTLPNFGVAATGESRIEMEIVPGPPRVCTTKCLCCIGQGGDIMDDLWNASMYLCPEHEFALFQRHG